MKELTSASDNFSMKYLFPLAFILMAIVLGYLGFKDKDTTQVIGVIVFLGFGVYLYKYTVLDCVNSVFDSEKTLLIKKSDIEFRVNIEDITGVTYTGYGKYRRVIVRFKIDTPLGRFIYFLPKSGLFGTKHKDIKDLIGRVKQARLNALGLPDGEV